MIKSFRHKGLERFFSSGTARGIQPEHRKRLRVILARLQAATGPRDMNLPGTGMHALRGDKEGFFAVRVSGNWRVTFRFEGKEVWEVDYCDYH